MDAQEFRSLQEAYEAVYENQQLDEGKSSRPRYPGGRGVLDQERRDEKRDSAAENMRGHTEGPGTVTKNPKKLRKQKAMGEIGEGVDIFDVILEHLVAEGYADTNEAALAIMANMSEEWRDDIMEVLDTPEKANEYARKNVRSMLGAFAKGVANKDISQLKTINKRTEGAKRAKRKAERKAAEEMKEGYDFFDVILEHLVAEGYADTNEAALAIMANMSEEWKQSIVEGEGGEEESKKPFTGEGPKKPKGWKPTGPKLKTGQRPGYAR